MDKAKNENGQNRKGRVMASAVTDVPYIQITATELKRNLGKYIKLARTQDVYVTENGRREMKMTNVFDERRSFIDSITGIAEDFDEDEARFERLSKKCGF